MRSAPSIECVDHVGEVDFGAWREAGVQCLLLDVEGTLAPYGSPEVDADVRASIQDARRVGMRVIGLVSNKTDLGFLGEVADQVGADGIFTPRTRAERKPRPDMLVRAMYELGEFRPCQTGMIGDKYTADVKAGLNAEVAKIAWTKRLGSTDHWGDRFFRRPYEAAFCRVPLSFLGGYMDPNAPGSR